MSKGKVFETTFSLAGKVAPSFSGTVSAASKALNTLEKNTTKTRGDIQALQSTAQKGVKLETSAAKKNVDDLKNRLKGLQSYAQKGLALGGAGLGMAAIVTKSAISAESAMSEFKKVFSGTKEEAEIFQKQFMDIAAETGKSFADVAKIAAAAAQSGIQSADINQFTKDAVRMGIAFDMSAEEAGQALAEMRVAFKMSQNEVVDFIDQINLLGNTTPQAGKKIVEIAQRVGPLGELAGFSGKEIAALGASMVALEPDVAATAIKKVIGSLTAGDSASKSMREAYRQLGLDVKKVSKDVQKDAPKTLKAVLAAIKKLPKDEQAASLSSVFGLEGIGGTSQLVGDIDNMIKNLEAVGDANEEAWKGSVLKEYESKAATTEFAIMRAKSALNNLSIVIGNQFLPYVTRVADEIQKVSIKMREWAEANPELVKKLSKVGVIIAAVIAGVSGLAIGLITLVGPIMIVVATLVKMGIAVKVATLAIGSLVKILAVALYSAVVKVGAIIIATFVKIGTGLMWLGRAFLFNPIGLAITAIIIAVGLLWYHWDTVCKLSKAGMDWLASAWSASISAIGSYFSGLWEGIKTGASTVMDWFKSLPSVFMQFGLDMLNGLANGIKNGVASAVAAAGEAAEAVKAKVKGFFGINSPSKLFMEYGNFNMQGLGLGMEQGTSEAERMAGHAVSGIVPTGQSLTGASTNNTSEFNITVNLTGDGDAQQQAQQGVMSAWQEIQQAQQRNARLAY